MRILFILLILFNLTNLCFSSTENIKVAILGEFTTKSGSGVGWDEFIYQGAKLQTELDKQSLVQLTKINVLTPIESYNKIWALANDPSYDIVMGYRRADFASMAKKAIDKKMIPFISAAGTTEDLFTPYSDVFSMATRDKFQAESIVQYILSHFRKNDKIGIIVAKDCTYCVDLEHEIKKNLEGSSLSATRVMELIGDEPISENKFKNDFLKYKIIILLTDEVSGLSIINLFSKNLFKGAIIGGDSWSLLSMDADSKYEPLRKICMVNILGYDPREKSLVNDIFIKKLNERYGTAPNDLSALGYDSMLVINEAARKCKSIDKKGKRKCLKDSILSVNIFGVTGKIQFSNDGARKGSAKIIKSKGCLKK